MQILVIGAILSGLIGMLISDHKGRGKLEGFLLGMFLGFIGWLIEALLSSRPQPFAPSVPVYITPPPQNSLETRWREPVPPPRGSPSLSGARLFWLPDNRYPGIDAIDQLRFLDAQQRAQGNSMREAVWLESVPGPIAAAFTEVGAPYRARWPHHVAVDKEWLATKSPTEPRLTSAANPPAVAEGSMTAAVECPRCGLRSAATKSVCWNCGATLSSPFVSYEIPPPPPPR